MKRLDKLREAVKLERHSGETVDIYKKEELITV